MNIIARCVAIGSVLVLTACATSITPMQASTMSCTELAQAAQNLANPNNALTNLAIDQAVSAGAAASSTAAAMLNPMASGLPNNATDQANLKVVTDEWNARCKPTVKTTPAKK